MVGIKCTYKGFNERKRYSMKGSKSFQVVHSSPSLACPPLKLNFINLRNWLESVHLRNSDLLCCDLEKESVICVNIHLMCQYQQTKQKKTHIAVKVINFACALCGKGGQHCLHMDPAPQTRHLQRQNKNTITEKQNKNAITERKECRTQNPRIPNLWLSPILQVKLNGLRVLYYSLGNLGNFRSLISLA